VIVRSRDAIVIVLLLVCSASAASGQDSSFDATFGRKEDIGARSLFRDIVNASLQPDLNSYRGFATQTFLEASPHVGLAISVRFDKK
jgi:hypothetical protein